MKMKMEVVEVMIKMKILNGGWYMVMISLMLMFGVTEMKRMIIILVVIGGQVIIGVKIMVANGKCQSMKKNMIIIQITTKAILIKQKIIQMQIMNLYEHCR